MGVNGCYMMFYSEFFYSYYVISADFTYCQFYQQIKNYGGTATLKNYEL